MVFSVIKVQLMQHNRDEATLPLNCLFQWPRIARSVCKWVNPISKERKQLLSFSSTIGKRIMLLEIRNKIVMINKGAERAEVPQGCFACLGRVGNLWVNADRVILSTGDWMEVVPQEEWVWNISWWQRCLNQLGLEDFAGNQLKQTESLVIIFKSLWRIQKYQRTEEGQI